MNYKFSFLILITTYFLNAQDCSNYFFLQNNKTIEMTITNSKGNITGKMIYTISGVNNSPGSVAATVNSEFTDSKGRSLTRAVNTMKCENGILMMDMKVFFPASQQEVNAASAGNVYLEYPATLKEGDKLKDGLFSMDITSSSGISSTIEISITERKVETKEPVTTAAGTWDCFKISSNNKIVTKVSEKEIPISTQMNEWYAPGFGVVKTESKTGKTEITSIK